MLQSKLGLTPEGARAFRRGVVCCVLANLVLILPAALLLALVDAFERHLSQGAPLPSLVPWLAACV